MFIFLNFCFSICICRFDGEQCAEFGDGISNGDDVYVLIGVSEVHHI